MAAGTFLMQGRAHAEAGVLRALMSASREPLRLWRDKSAAKAAARQQKQEAAPPPGAASSPQPEDSQAAGGTADREALAPASTAAGGGGGEGGGGKVDFAALAAVARSLAGAEYGAGAQPGPQSDALGGAEATAIEAAFLGTMVIKDGAGGAAAPPFAAAGGGGGEEEEAYGTMIIKGGGGAKEGDDGATGTMVISRDVGRATAALKSEGEATGAGTVLLAGGGTGGAAGADETPAFMRHMFGQGGGYAGGGAGIASSPGESPRAADEARYVGGHF